MEDRLITLASGKKVLVTAEHVAVLDTDGDAMTVRQMDSISSVSRDGASVAIKAVRQRTLQIDMRTSDDAEALEASITTALDLLPPEERTLGNPSTTGSRASRYGQPLTIAGFACAGLVMLGSLSPWVTGDSGDAAGIDGDGAITLMLGALAAVLLYLHGRTNDTMTRVPRVQLPRVLRMPRLLRVLAALAFLVSAITGGNIINNIWTSEQDGISLSVGWGLWIVVLASVLGAGVSMVKQRSA